MEKNGRPSWPLAVLVVFFLAVAIWGLTVAQTWPQRWLPIASLGFAIYTSWLVWRRERAPRKPL
jgi:hypothetical protein